MKYFKLLILSACLLVIFLIATFLTDSVFEVNNISLATLSNLATVFVSIPTLLIATLLYKKFTGNQVLVDKQTQQVMDLIAYISTLNFFFYPRPGSKYIQYMTGVNLKSSAAPSKNRFNLKNKKWQNYIFYADESMHEVTDHFMNLHGSIYMPTSIADKLGLFFNRKTEWWLDNYDENPAKKYFNVGLSPADTYRKHGYRSYFMKYVSIDINILSSNILEVYKDLVVWVQDNNTEVYQHLNIADLAKRP